MTKDSELLCNDLSSQYDAYYNGGKNSLYNKRFGDKKISLNEELVIVKILKRLLKKNTSKHLKILDFGCGDGRIYQVIEEFMRDQKNVSCQFVGYDLCKTAIIDFENLLLAKGYNEQNGVFVKDNIKVYLVLADIIQKLDEIAKDIGSNFDLCLCIYGVIQHIPYRKNRLANLKLMNNSLAEHGELLLSLGSKNVFPKEAIAYEVIRQQLLNCAMGNLSTSADIRQQMLKLAIEPGDLYYCKYSVDNNNSIDIFAHVYTPSELLEDLKLSGFAGNAKVKIMSLYNPYEITHKVIKSYLDMLFTKLFNLIFFTSDLKNEFGMYLYINISKKI